MPLMGVWKIKADTTTAEAAFVFYLGGDAYTAPVVVKSDGEASEFLYLHRDYLGSIVAITNQEGELVEKRHFDPWGNITGIQDGQNNDVAGLTVLDRGYTGHEHLQGVELIHMNGRLYDARLHRFLAPDNFIQNHLNTQNFNRYTYVLNNPLLYVDPSGEIIGTVITAVFEGIKNVIAHGINFDHYNWQQTKNAWDIDRGMFKGNFGQLLGKWTWGLVPNLAGNVVAHGYNITGNVHEVTHLEGATAISTTRDRGAFALGYYLNGPRGFRADWRDHLFVHEYGSCFTKQHFRTFILNLSGSYQFVKCRRCRRR